MFPTHWRNNMYDNWFQQRNLHLNRTKPRVNISTVSSNNRVESNRTKNIKLKYQFYKYLVNSNLIILYPLFIYMGIARRIKVLWRFENIH